MPELRSFFFFNMIHIWYVPYYLERKPRGLYKNMRVLRTGLGDGLGDGLGFPKCKFKCEHHNRRVLRSEK
jgi:hypothetical protein